MNSKSNTDIQIFYILVNWIQYSLSRIFLSFSRCFFFFFVILFCIFFLHSIHPISKLLRNIELNWVELLSFERCEEWANIYIEKFLVNDFSNAKTTQLNLMSCYIIYIIVCKMFDFIFLVSIKFIFYPIFWGFFFVCLWKITNERKWKYNDYWWTGQSTIIYVSKYISNNIANALQIFIIDGKLLITINCVNNHNEVLFIRPFWIKI